MELFFWTGLEARFVPTGAAELTSGVPPLESRGRLVHSLFRLPPVGQPVGPVYRFPVSIVTTCRPICKGMHISVPPTDRPLNLKGVQPAKVQANQVNLNQSIF